MNRNGWSDRIFWGCDVMYRFPPAAMLVVGTGSKAWEVPTSPFSATSNFSESLQWEPSCQYRPLQGGARITADMPPRLEGTWVSTRYIINIITGLNTKPHSSHAYNRLVGNVSIIRDEECLVCKCYYRINDHKY